MLFNSLQYAYFLPLAVALYYLAPARARVGLLLVLSYVFYASWNPLYLFLIVGLTTMNFVLGIVMEPLHQRSASASGWLLTLGIALNVGVLGYYKYSAFLVNNLATALHLAGLHVRFPAISPFIPLGISFFIFEFIHYLMDIRKGQPVVRSFLKFATFAAFFPTQIAGPIKRYEDFIPQLSRVNRFEWTRIFAGLQLVVIGLFKKAVLADNLAPLVESQFHHVVRGPAGLSPIESWLTIMAFAMQIYYDFSGYTDIGRGSAIMLGYHVPENFNRPYLARNVSDFWRRWHMSLSTWLRDYLYIPLGGNRSHQARNLLVTMLIGGLWHGANWTFIVWGGWLGLLLVGYWKYMTWQKAKLGTATALPAPSGIIGTLTTALSIGVTFILICVSWVFFRAANLTQAFLFLHSMFALHTNHQHYLWWSQRIFILAVTLGTFAWEASIEWHSELRSRIAWTGLLTPLTWGWRILQPAAYAALFLVTIVAQPNTAPQFIYFRF